MPRTKRATLKFSIIQLNLMIRAVDHLIDAYATGDSPAAKATVTNLENIREILSETSSDLHV